MDMKNKKRVKNYNDLKKVISKVKKAVIFTLMGYMIIGSASVYTEAKVKEEYETKINSMKVITNQLLNENGFEWTDELTIEKIN